MAGVLTDNLVMQRARIDDIRRVKILNVCGAQLQDIGVLRFAVNLEVLSLSLNEITDLGAISRCMRLRELYLRRNQVCDINQVLHLTRLPELSILNLSDNPICFDPNYRKFTIAAIPSLTKLDDIDITGEERRDALCVFPELTHFAPPASPYAEPLHGRYASVPYAHSTQHSKGNESSNGYVNVTNNNSSSISGGGGNNYTNTNNNSSSNNNNASALQRHALGGQREASVQKAPRRGGLNNSPTSSNNYNNNNNKGSNSMGMARQGAKHENNNNNTSAGVSSSGYRLFSGTSPQAQNSMPSTASEFGPTELGVIQAVKVLCSELSTNGLNEIRSFIDSMYEYEDQK